MKDIPEIFFGAEGVSKKEIKYELFYIISLMIFILSGILFLVFKKGTLFLTSFYVAIILFILLILIMLTERILERKRIKKQLEERK